MFFIIKHSFVCDDPQSGDPIFVNLLQNVCIGWLECKKRDLMQRIGDHFFGWGSGGTACSTFEVASLYKPGGFLVSSPNNPLYPVKLAVKKG